MNFPVNRLPRRKKGNRSTHFNTAILAAFLILSIICLTVMQDTMMDNAQRIGTVLSKSHCVEAEQNLIAYETLMDLSVKYVDGEMGTEGDHEEWIQRFLSSLTDVTGPHTIDPYAVIDGKIITANPWEGDDSLDLENAIWYQQAIAAEGEIIYTDAYTDTITGMPVVTIAKETSVPGNVVAFDIFPENFRTTTDTATLPENSNYYLCDASGTLLYSSANSNIDSEELQPYLYQLVQSIQAGTLTEENSVFQNPSGERRVIYYNVASNGWYSLVTIPYSELIQGLRTATILYAGVLLIFLGITIFMNIRDHRLNQRMARSNETVRVLGNSYYAIYRMDFSACTYEMIKGSDYIREHVNKTGGYEDLLHAISQVIEPSAKQEFLNSFSLENIQRLAAQRVRDFGGDFQRLFNEEYRWVNVRLLIDESLSSTEAVLCFREVEGEKQRQLQQMELLRSSLESARQSEAARNMFFSSMSHDMRTPLNAIIGLSELAQTHLDDRDKTLDYIQKINISSKQLLNLINDILEISRMEQSTFTLNNSTLDLRACVENIASSFQVQAEREGKVFSVSFDLDNPWVDADDFRLSQILNNLLSNAFKFTRAGDAITLDVREVKMQERGRYQIVVSDSGVGMTQEFLEKIFLPYQRETRFGAKSVSGTGLGMPIVKNIVSQMGGEITVDSHLGMGSVFTVTLPLQQAGQASQPAKEPEPAPKPPQPKELHLEGKRILLAEDNEINMEITTELLSLHGIHITQAWNGREALEAFRQSEPFWFDAILMDMQMPEMDGCQAAQAIRRLDRPDAAKVPIIAVTANAFSEDLAATTAAGMNAHISKPIDFQLFRQTLERFLLSPQDSPPKKS